MSINYNIVQLSLDNGLTNKAISSGRDYLILLESPANANVKIKLGESTADAIPLKENYSLNTSNVKDIFVSCDSIAGGRILIGQANTKEDLQIFPVPSLEFSNEVLNNLRFAPNGTAVQIPISAGTSYDFTKAGQTAIRFVSAEELGVELNSNSIKYPMYEEEIYLQSIENITFHNDTTKDTILTIWNM